MYVIEYLHVCNLVILVFIMVLNVCMFVSMKVRIFICMYVRMCIQGVPGGMCLSTGGVPYVKIYRYNPKQIHKILNFYGYY